MKIKTKLNLMKKYTSWNNYPKVKKQKNFFLERFSSTLLENESLLAYGNGRSYGDVCLNSSGTILHTINLNKIISFDEKKGILKCESGITFDEILKKITEKGWFLPVVPGTKYITLGGAVANDIHGKNHHKSGSFGNFIKSFELIRSDGKKYLCSETENKDLFFSTIGGLGLTGVISWVELDLRKIKSNTLSAKTQRFSSLEEYWEINNTLEMEWEYTVAWLDCIRTKSNNYRGVFHSGNHSTNPINKKVNNFKITVPFNSPLPLINKLSIKILNSLYFLSNKNKPVHNTHYESFFFPLDKVKNWNRAYGKKGFIQYQFLLPKEKSKETVREILDFINQNKLTPSLCVLKTFGDIPSKGILSFPRAGVTLAIDFPIQNMNIFGILDSLDKMVINANGSIYPAKDARMSSKTFRKSFQNYSKFLNYKDPRFNSDFSERISSS